MWARKEPKAFWSSGVKGIMALMRYGTGCLCLDGQLVPALCPDEHGRAGRSYIDGTSGKGVSTRMQKANRADTSILVLVVPLWDYSWRIVELGHQYHGASGDIGPPWGNVPNQDRPGSAVRYSSMQFVSGGPGCSIKWPGADDCPRGPSILRPAGLAKRDSAKALSRFPRLKGTFDLQPRKSQLREKCRDGYDISAHALIFAIVRANDTKLSVR